MSAPSRGLAGLDPGVHGVNAVHKAVTTDCGHDDRAEAVEALHTNVDHYF